MPRRKRTAPPPTPAGWRVSVEWTANGRHVEPGTELRIRGERGRFVFVRYVATDKAAEWIDVRDADGRWRAFRPERVKTVHRKTLTRPPRMRQTGSTKT